MPSKTKPSTGSKAKTQSSIHALTTLTPTREAEIAAKAQALGNNTLVFPGKAAQRIAWSAKILAAAVRDASDLVLTPFPKGQAPLTLDEIRGQAEQIQFLRLRQSRWRTLLLGVREAAEEFGPQAAEADKHRKKLLKLFGMLYSDDAKGRKWVADVRAGSGDADLLQDVVDILERGKLHKAEIEAAPRGEAEAYARLQVLFPTLSELLAAKSLNKEARKARRERDAAYTLVIQTERRIRAAAEYWYADEDAERFKDYAAFPTSRGGGEEEGAEEGEGAEEEEVEASEEGESESESEGEEAAEDGAEDEGEVEEAAPAEAATAGAKKKPVPA